MHYAFQIIAFTDRRNSDGSPVIEVYAATTDTAEEALALAIERLPTGWNVSVTPAFQYSPAVVDGIPRGELYPVS